MTDTVLISLITASSVAFGVILSTVSTIIQSGISKRAEERKIVADLVVRLTVEQWKITCEKHASEAVKFETMKKNDPMLERSGLSFPSPSISAVAKSIAAEVKDILR